VGEGEEGYSYGVVGEMGPSANWSSDAGTEGVAPGCYEGGLWPSGSFGEVEVGRGDEFVKRWVIVVWLVRKPGKPSLCGVGVKGESGGKPPAVQRRLRRASCAGVP
jgi:hypothetical protein